MNSSASINTPRLTTKKLESFRGMGAVQASLFEDVLPMSMQCSSTELTINSLRPRGDHKGCTPVAGAKHLEFESGLGTCTLQS